MLRTLALAAAASLTLGVLALTPSAASAHGWRHHHGHHHHRHWHGYPRFAFGGPGYVTVNPCIRTRWVPTPWGPRPRRVNVCW